MSSFRNLTVECRAKTAEPTVPSDPLIAHIAPSIGVESTSGNLIPVTQ